MGIESVSSAVGLRPVLQKPRAKFIVSRRLYGGTNRGVNTGPLAAIKAAANVRVLRGMGLRLGSGFAVQRTQTQRFHAWRSIRSIWLVAIMLGCMVSVANAGDEAPAARQMHDYLTITMELVRDDVTAGEVPIDYSHKNDAAVLRQMSQRLLTLDADALNQLATSWRDVGTASWPAIANTIERCVDSILDGGRVFVDAEALHTMLFIPLDAGLTPGLRDTVVTASWDRDHEGRSQFDRLRSYVVIDENPMARDRIDTWTATDSEASLVVRDFVRDAIIALIAVETEARVADHQQSIRKVRAKRD